MGRSMVLAFALSCAGQLAAQEIGAFGALATGGRYNYYGGGLSIARYIAASDTNTFREQAPLVGLRLAASALVSTESAPPAIICMDDCSNPDPGPAQVFPVQVALLLRPYASSGTRFDLGAGVNFFGMSGGANGGGAMLMGNLGLSVRMRERTWLSFSYDLLGNSFVEWGSPLWVLRQRHALRIGASWN